LSAIQNLMNLERWWGILNKVFTYRDTVVLLGLGALIFLISFVGSLFFNFVSIFMIGLCVSFGNRVKRLSEQLEYIDRVNKEVNDVKKKG